MKKFRFLIRIVTVVLFLITIAGIVILVVNENLNWLDASFEIIAFSLGSFGMFLAVLEQINSVQEERRYKRMMTEIRNLNREHDEDDKVDTLFQEKLDKILAMDQKIYDKLSEKPVKK